MSSIHITPEPLFAFRGGRVRGRGGAIPFFLLAVLFSAVVLSMFHDRFWYGPDDGAYAYVASRILAGDVLHRDIQDIHPGYINFVNAFALKMFGDDVLSLRYPLVLLGVVQAGLLFLLLMSAGRLVALTGSAALTALSFVQFLNPTAHWYGLFLTIALISVLTWVPREVVWRTALLGFLLMTLVLFRQLTGVIVGIGVVGYLLLELPPAVRGGGRVGRGLLVLMAGGLAAYALFKTTGVAAILYAGPAVGILVWQALKLRAGDGEVLRMLAGLAVGGIVGFLPLFFYHLAHGSLGDWYQDAVVAALGLTELAFIEQPSYAVYALFGAMQLLSPASFAGVVNGLFWVVLPLLPALLGIAVFLRVSGDGMVHPLPYVAAFYTMVSLHFQIPIYLFYTVGLAVAALLYLTVEAAPRLRPAVACAAVGLVAVALFYQAAQPLSRGGVGIAAGERPAVVRAELDRAPVWMPAEDAAAYGDLVALIERETRADETILALPVSPELYFLSGRRAALPFFNSAIGVADYDALGDAIAALQAAPPALVFFRPDDKYNNFVSAGLMAFVKGRYDMWRRVGDTEVYRPRLAPSLL